MSTSDRKSYHHGSLRGELLRVGRLVLEEGGLEGLSLRELARRAGVSANAPYRHFADREAFLAALAAEGFRELGARLGASGDLLTSGLAYVGFAEANPGLFGVMFGPVLAGCTDFALHESSMAAYADLIARVGAEGPDDPRAVEVWALVHGLAVLRINGLLSAPGVVEAVLGVVSGRIEGQG